MRGNNENQMRRRRKAEAGLLVMNAGEEDDCLWSILLQHGCAGSGALAKKRTAPVGCVGRRFRHDSLGSHTCVHCVYGPKKPEAVARDPPSLTTPNSITWVCGAAKFTLKQVQSGEGGGVLVTICTIELLNTDSGFTFFSRGVVVLWWVKRDAAGEPFTWQGDWKVKETIHGFLKCYFRHLCWLNQRFERHVKDLTKPSPGNGGRRICFLI